MGIVIRMASFLRFLFCISIALIALIEIVHSMAYDVGKLKTKMTKMKSTLTRHNTKEQSKVSAQILLPKFLDKAKNAVGRLHEDEYTNGYATFELLVRRTQTGPWYNFFFSPFDVCFLCERYAFYARIFQLSHLSS